jgi:hypothetical protein
MAKIQTAVDALGLESVIETICERRRGGESLRDLRDYYNEQVIEATVTAAGGSVLTDTNVVRQALTGELDSAGRRIEIEHALSDMDIDIDTLKSRLISHETLRKYLTQRDVTPETESDAVTETNVKETIDWAKRREEAIIRRKLEQLADAGAIDFDEIELETTITVTCTDTGDTYRLDNFINRGGCEQTE